MKGPRSAAVVAAVAAVALLAGCSSPAEVPSPSLTATDSGSGTGADLPMEAPPSKASALRACLGPWEGSGGIHHYVLVGVADPDSVPTIEVGEPDVHVAAWLNATPPHEGIATFAPRQDAQAALLGSGVVRFNLTGDPAHGEGDLPPGSYEFSFNPETAQLAEDIRWEVSIREAPRAGAPQCR